MRSLLILVFLVSGISFYAYMKTAMIDIPKTEKTFCGGNSEEEFKNIEIIKSFFFEIINQKMVSLVDIHFAENYDGAFSKENHSGLSDREYLKKLIQDSRFPFNCSPLKLGYMNAKKNRVLVRWPLEENEIPQAHSNNAHKYIYAVFYLEKGKITKSNFYYNEI